MKTKRLLYYFIVFSLFAGCEPEESRPSKPSNLNLTVLSKEQIKLTWKDNSDNEQGFIIERSPGNANLFSEIYRAVPNSIEYTNRSLSPGTRYYYRICAFNTEGKSGYSEVKYATTLALQVPAKPTNLLATPLSDTQIKLQWQDNSNNESGFRIERKKQGSDSFAELAVTAANQTTCQDNQLTASTTYLYRVCAINEDGTSDYSNEVTVTTMVSLPAPPSNLQASAVSSSKINLTWQDNSANETGFRLERKTGTSSWQEIIILSANTVSYQNSGLSPSTGYSYRVRAYNNGGNSAYSNTASATTPSLKPVPPVISAPGTSSGPFTVTITYSSWPYLVSNWDRYELEESTTSSTSGFSLIHTSAYGIHTSPYYVNLTRAPGTYYYRARVYVGGGVAIGYSDYSNVVKVIVTAPSRSITLKNSMSTGLNIHDIVQVKVATTASSVYTRSDLLTNDPARCLYLPGESIKPAGSKQFTMTLGNNYFVYIGIGIWDMDNFNCSYTTPWFKRTFFTTVNFRTYYVWTVVQVTGHTSGNWTWTISGSYLNNTLVVTPAGGSSIKFNVTSNNPIN